MRLGALLVLVLLLLLPVSARASQYEGVYVWDMAQLLTEDQTAKLQETAASIAENYQCGTYIVTVNDFRDYSQISPYEAAKKIYSTMNFGVGSGKDGELLMLSMDDRDFAIIAYGSFGNAAFTDYGKEKLDEVYLDNFRNNDWFGGFSDYLTQSEYYLKMAREGTFFDVDTDPEKLAADRMFGLLLSFIIGIVVALITCIALRAGMKTAVEAGNANVYLVPGSVKITGSRDNFVRRTTTTRHIERSSGSSGGGGGTHVDSGGFSGHSGKF